MRGTEESLPQRRWSRRRFLAAGPLLALQAGEELVPFSDYTPEFRAEAQANHPRVKWFDLRRLTSWATPSEEFFAFHQTEPVRAEAKPWRLRIAGTVERPAEFSLEELLRRVDRRDVAVTLECSGNSGDPRIMNGLVGNAVWTGVSLAGILRECGVKSEAREVVFFGMDSEREKKWQAGDAEYTSPHGRSIHVQDALAPEGLLAFAMNGKPLPAEQGFPLRVILPGWYGMAQVKWLARIEVIDRRYEGRHMARNYHSLRAAKTPEGTLWLDTSISRNNLKSVIARVTRRPYRVAGAAWGGRRGLRRSRCRSTADPGGPPGSTTGTATPPGCSGRMTGRTPLQDATSWSPEPSMRAGTYSPLARSCGPDSPATGKTTPSGPGRS